MINKLKKINDAVLSFMTNNIAKIMGIVIAGLVLVSVLSYRNYNRPETAAEFANTSVKILSLSQQSGGSGVILTSTPFGSKILTNKHVCRLIERGGYVSRLGRTYLIDSYKKYPKHDLCLVYVIYDFGVTTKIADNRPEDFSDTSVSGHPGLMPPVLTKGYFSGREQIQLIVGIKKCNNKTPREYLVYCYFFGGIPVIETFESQLVTATILPGSSGSGVFNKDGELSGLVFAGRGKGLMYAYIVPHEYLVNFMEMEHELEWKKAGMGFNYKDFFKRIFNFQNACRDGKKELSNLCNYVQSYLIWNI